MVLALTQQVCECVATFAHEDEEEELREALRLSVAAAQAPPEMDHATTERQRLIREQVTWLSNHHMVILYN